MRPHCGGTRGAEVSGDGPGDPTGHPKASAKPTRGVRADQGGQAGQGTRE